MERERSQCMHVSGETSMCVCVCVCVCECVSVMWGGGGGGGRGVGRGRQESVCVCVYEMGPQCVYVGGLYSKWLFHVKLPYNKTRQ